MSILSQLGITSRSGRRGGKRLPKIPKGLKKAARKKKSKELHAKKVAARKKEIADLKRYVGRA